jgi:hypothetical protein
MLTLYTLVGIMGPALGPSQSAEVGARPPRPAWRAARAAGPCRA